jgi:general secretion pathway protein M
MLSRLQQLSLRDQAMLALLAAALLLYLLYQMAWRPLAAANAQLQLQNAAATRTLETVAQLAAQYRQLKQGNAQGGPPQGSLTALVDQTVATNKLQMSRFQPGSGGDVQVRLDNAPFDQVLRWLHQLETQHRVAVKELAVSPGADGGLVSVSVRLFRP